MTRSLDDIRFPTSRQRDLTGRIVEELTSNPNVEAIAITASLAMGYAEDVSDLDLAICARTDHVQELQALCAEINERYDREANLWVDTDVIDGNFQPGAMGWCEVDSFEKEVGNLVAYAIPVYERTDLFKEIHARWTPYFDEELARRREHRWAQLSANHCVQGMKSLRRGFPLDAVDHFHMGVQSYVALLFVAARVYPVDYLKRVDLHLVNLLGRPGLGDQLREIYDFGAVDSDKLEASFRKLDALTRAEYDDAGPSAFP